MRGYWSFVICLAAVFSLAPLAIDMYLPALPAMAEGLSSSIDDIEASVAVFLLGYAASQLVLGPLSDRIGRIRVLIGGLGLFAVGSVLCGVATSPVELYAYRFIQAIGGGASVVVFAMVQDRFDEKESARVISYIMAVVVVAPLIAPIAGGEILVRFGWEWIFFALAASGTIVLAAAPLILTDAPTARTAPRASFTAGLGKLAGDYRVVLGNGPVMAHILTGAFSFAGLFAFVAGSPFVYITYFGVAPDDYGYLVGANAAVMIAMNLLNARVLHNMPPTSKAIVGAVVIGIASVALVLFNAAAFGLWWIVGGVVAYVGVLGLISANAIAGALASFSAQRGTASAVYGVCQFGLGALSSAVISWIDSTDATAMVHVMAGCGLLALLSALPLFIIRRRTGPNMAAEL